MTAGRAPTGLDLEVAASLAAVPGWAPIGADPHRYREMLHGTDGSAPAPEALLFHQERWGHVERYDDFAGLFDASGFDATTLVALAEDAGAERLMFTARSTDGWRWWGDAGPASGRDLVWEIAEVAARRGVPFGVRYDAGAATDEHELCDDLGNLLSSYPISAISGNWPPERDRAVEAVIASSGRPVDVDVDADGPRPSPPGWSRRSTRSPSPGLPVRSWISALPTGSGFGWNRSDRSGRRHDAPSILGRYVDALAGGGRLRLVVPLTDTGTIDSPEAAAIVQAGSWVRALGAELASSTIVSSAVDPIPATDGPVVVVTHGGDPTVAWLRDAARQVAGVEELSTDDTGQALRAPVSYEQDEHGLHIRGTIATSRSESASQLPRVFRISLVDDAGQAPLFAAEPRPPTPPLGPLLADRRPGDIVQLGDGTYEGPAVVPPGMIVRGLGPARTTVRSAVLSSGGRVEHLRLDTLEIEPGATDTMVLGCQVDRLIVRGDRCTVRATTIGTLSAADVDGLTVSRCRAEAATSAPALVVVRGAGHLVEGCSVANRDLGIALEETAGATVRGCTFRDVRTAIGLFRTERTHAAANRIDRATRAIEVQGGDDILVDGNAVVDADSGALVHAGATHCEVSGNFWERCRIGMLVWHAPDVRHRGNTAIDLDEPDEPIRFGP